MKSAYENELDVTIQYNTIHHMMQYKIRQVLTLEYAIQPFGPFSAFVKVFARHIFLSSGWDAQLQEQLHSPAGVAVQFRHQDHDCPLLRQLWSGNGHNSFDFPCL